MTTEYNSYLKYFYDIDSWSKPHKLVDLHFLIVINAYQTKCTFPPTIPPKHQPPPSPPQPLPDPFPTHPTPPMNLLGPILSKFPLGSNKKNMCLLKFNFRDILFYKYWIILKKIYPLQVPPPWYPQLSI